MPTKTTRLLHADGMGTRLHPDQKHLLVRDRVAWHYLDPRESMKTPLQAPGFVHPVAFLGDDHLLYHGWPTEGDEWHASDGWLLNRPTWKTTLKVTRLSTGQFATVPTRDGCDRVFSTGTLE